LRARLLRVALALGVGLGAAGTARAAVVDTSAPDGGVVDRDAPTVAARVQAGDTVHVGDAVTLVVTAITRRNVPVNLPGTLDLGAFSLLDRKESEQDLGDGRVRHEFTLTIAAYESGDKEIPAVEVTYLGKAGDVRTARTAPLPLKIRSLIANEPEPALKDAVGPVVVLEDNRALIYGALGLLAAALGALVTWLVVRRLRARIAARPGPPPRPSHEIALEKLDRLGQYGFLEDADNRPFYFAVSEIIREYLGARFGFDSLELTTDELVDELRRSAGRELGLYGGEVQGWLAACDLVKFAKISPSATEARGSLETALRIVTSTRPRPEVAAPVEGAAPANPTEAARG
jgi:oxygen tolerance protein BatD